jgi:SAM-dependent methyltransferase
MKPGAWLPEGRENTMTAETDWVPPGTDTGKANIARVYDWWIGGTHNFRADQDAARALIAVEPKIRAMARANRAFLGRAVRFLADEAGIRQFLDIGSGIPTEQNVHQVAQQAAPGSRVVYADNDDVAVGHSKLMLDGIPHTAVIEADLRDPDGILGNPETRRLIDFTRPVGLLLVAVLHLIPDNDHPREIVAALRAALAPGSYLVISHSCRDTRPEVTAAFQSVYNSRIAAQAAIRTHKEIIGFFDGFTLIEPGLVWAPEWHPDSPGDIPEEPAQYWMKAGIGRYDGASSPQAGTAAQ